MSSARLESLGAGHFRLSGVLDAKTVGQVLRQSRERFAAVPHIQIDMTAVSESDSAGMALLIEWLRLARQASQTVQFVNVPAQIIALARISEVEDLLQTSTPAAGAPPDAAAVEKATAPA